MILREAPDFRTRTAEDFPARNMMVRRLSMVAVWLLGWVALGCAALHLSAFGLARFLNSDFLTPYFFCLDVLTGSYPLSGWTLSASPYFVPDHVLLGGLLSGFGRTSFAYALYPLVYYVLLVILAGCCVRTAVGRTAAAIVASLLFGNLLLVLRGLPGHALYLWWIGTPCCHGGVFLLGFAYLALLGSGLRQGVVGWRVAPLCALSVIGLCSDTLFFFQILLPIGVALFVWRARVSSALWLRWHGGCVVSALLVSLVFKPLCVSEGWFYFGRMFRRAPTPVNQWHALVQFVSDLPTIMRDGWGFMVLILAAAIFLFRSTRKATGPTPETALTQQQTELLDFYRVFCVSSLLIMLPLPILTCAWRIVYNVRYLFNWLILPGFLLTLAFAVKWETRALLASERGRWWALGSVAAFFLFCLGWAVHGIGDEPLRFPYPPDVAAFDALLQRHSMKNGLAEYWKAKYVTALSHAGADLRQIRPTGEPYFWDNNTFRYYGKDAGGKFAWPDYEYLLVDTLDEQALVKSFGEPRVKEEAGHFHVWLYDSEGARRIRDALEPVVREKLGPQRLPKLEQIFNADAPVQARPQNGAPGQESRSP